MRARMLPLLPPLLFLLSSADSAFAGERPVGGPSREMYAWTVDASTGFRGDGCVSLVADARRSLDHGLALGFDIGFQVSDEEFQPIESPGSLLPQAHFVAEYGPGRALHGPYLGAALGMRTYVKEQVERTSATPDAQVFAGFRAIWHPGFVMDLSVGAYGPVVEYGPPILVKVAFGGAPLPKGTAPLAGYRDDAMGRSPEERVLIATGITLGGLTVLGGIAAAILLPIAWQNATIDFT